MALTTQRSTVVNVYRGGKPLRPAVLWPDQRKTYGLPPVGGIWGAIFSVAGLRKTVAWYLENRDWWERVLDGRYRLQRLGVSS